MSSAELTGWFAYLRIDDQVRADWIARAIVKAFNGDRKQAGAIDDDDEEIIDTTDPTFAETFQGFIGQPGGNQPQRSIPPRQTNTQILMG